MSLWLAASEQKTESDHTPTSAVLLNKSGYKHKKVNVKVLKTQLRLAHG